MDGAENDEARAWREQAVKYARIMSRVKWAPVAGTMPNRSGGYFQKGRTYTGVPYSSVRWEGRYIGFDIYLKTFLAAVENPESVLYTENLRGKVPNAAAYYGKVCSSFTSYALQCGIWNVSRRHNPPYRDGVVPVEPQSAQAAEVGDIVHTPPSGGSHVEIVTGITRDDNGRVTHVRVEDSWPPTVRNINRSASNFDRHISARNRKLYRITDMAAWRGENKAESFRFPNYAEDSATPTINRVVLLDRGDWVPYHKNQAVKFNVMDKTAETLVIKRDGNVVEEIPVEKPGAIERTFTVCGDYTAHCIMNDGALSQACEFAVCDLDFNFSVEEALLNEAWEIEFASDNMDVVIVQLSSEACAYGRYRVFVTEEDRQKGKVAVPAGLVRESGKLQVLLTGENRYGRLKKRRDIAVKRNPGDIVPVSVSRAMGGAEAVTVSVWAARDARAMGRRNDILQIPISGASVKIGLMFSDTDAIRASGRTEAGEPVQGVGTVRQWNDKMRHIVAVYDAAGNDIRLYVDGVRQETEGKVEWKNDEFSSQSGQPGAIGMAARGAHLFLGAIRDVRIYTRALSEADVQAIFKADPGAELPPNLTGQWVFRD